MISRSADFPHVHARTSRRCNSLLSRSQWACKSSMVFAVLQACSKEDDRAASIQCAGESTNVSSARFTAARASLLLSFMMSTTTLWSRYVVFAECSGGTGVCRSAFDDPIPRPALPRGCFKNSNWRYSLDQIEHRFYSEIGRAHV